MGEPKRARAPGELTARIWDLPVRLVHALLIVLVPFMWWSAHAHHLGWHRLSGYLILGAVVFRLIWGVVGSPTARFARFLAGPRTIAAYVGGRLGRVVVGHNPLGGWSVAALLAATLLQLGLGLFSINEDADEGGPLAKYVDFDTGRAIAHWHHKAFWLLVVLIGIHLIAVLVYAMRRRNLIWPMVTGRAALPQGAEPPVLAGSWRAVGAALVAFSIAWFVAHGLSLGLK